MPTRRPPSLAPRRDAGRSWVRRVRRRRLLVEPLEVRLCLSHFGEPAVPAFSSLPGADHTIYLDFNGHVVEGTSWNNYYNQTTLDAPPYDIDGNPAAFNATELARIEEAWKRVAEDFIPFDVNVTTVDPGVEALRNSGSGDAQWGVRAVMTNEANMVTNSAERCGCGGIAYINSFNWNSDTPVWVYTTGGKSVAEAASHEVGHALGLSHDGTATSGYYTGHGSGETGWAPIMGVGYYQNVTQWDRGEYYGSNNAGSDANYNKGPDDLAIITSYNGFGYRADDHGDVSAAASPLSQSGTTVSGSGIIATTSDVDAFSFTTGSGVVSLNIAPFTPGPNLDVKATLYDSSGGLVATVDPTTTLTANFSLTLAAGQYFLHVEGTGVGDPGANPPSGYSDYASLGRYSISGTVVESDVAPQLSVDDVTVDEDAAVAYFTISLLGTATEPVSVNYATSDGTATAPSDYLAASGQVTFQPGGATTQTVRVAINDDSLSEASETFSLLLSGATGAAISDGQGLATIIDNDATFSISDVSASEGNLAKGKKNGGSPTTTPFVFTVSLSKALAYEVTVNFATQDGSATTADGDYLAASGQLRFSPGQVSQNVAVTVYGDNTQEPDETFSVVLTNPVGATLADGSGVGTILDDDSGGGGGGGGGKGGGNGGGGGKPPKIALLEPIADPFWFFEAPEGLGHENFAGHEHAHHHGHEHGHGHEHAGFAGHERAGQHFEPTAAPLDAALAAWNGEQAGDPFGEASPSAREDAGALATPVPRSAPVRQSTIGVASEEEDGLRSSLRRSEWRSLNDAIFGDPLEDPVGVL